MIFHNFKELMAVTRGSKEKVRAVVAGSHKKDAVSSVLEAWREGVVEPILVGDTELTAKIIREEGEDPAQFDIRPCLEGMNPAETAVEIIKNGEASFLIKGTVETGELFHPVMKKENGLRTGRVISHVVFYYVPYYHKMFLLTDAGICAYPTLEQKKHILENAVDVFRAVGVDNPKVAVLTCKETADPHMPETMDGLALKEMNERGEIPNCIVEGPISLDLALSKERSAIKKYTCPYAGDFDILVVPNVHAGNLLGKSWELMPESEQASVVVGAKIPIVMTSRGAPAVERLRSILLAGMIAGKLQDEYRAL